MKFLHAVILTEPHSGFHQSLLETYPGAYVLNDKTFLIRSDKLSNEISKDVGIGEESGPTGAVFKLNGTYSGYARSSLWEWLKIEE